MQRCWLQLTPLPTDWQMAGLALCPAYTESVLARLRLRGAGVSSLCALVMAGLRFLGLTGGRVAVLRDCAA